MAKSKDLPRFLRRHYPHQVQGVTGAFSFSPDSQPVAPPLFSVATLKRKAESGKRKNALILIMIVLVILIESSV